MFIQSISDVNTSYVGQCEASQIRKFHENRILNRIYLEMLPTNLKISGIYFIIHYLHARQLRLITATEIQILS